MITPSTVRKPKRRRFWQISRIYGFIRARQLEGTLILGPRQGVFIINAARVLAGWGHVSETRWPYPKRGASWPPPEPPGLDKIARFNKIYAYSRVRNLEDARRCLAYGGPFSVSISIHSGWAKAPNGAISMPEPGQSFTENHCVCVVGYDDNTRLLHFVNSWGPRWGDKGFGFLPYDYFTRFSQDAWHFQPPFLGCRIKERTPKKIICIDTLHANAMGYACVVHDLWDSADNTRAGWCIATERDAYLDVEEFFVRPGYRRTGLGGILMSRLLEDSNGSDPPLRFWIPYADCNTPSRCILPMNHLLTKNGFVARASGVNWAQYVAEKSTVGGRNTRTVNLLRSRAVASPPGGIFELDMGLSEIKPNKQK
jgi:GNAT superfamily N-acetyltransferase